ncbi:MAG: LysR family transcriptional regulator [Syntrophomonadaceae bacterium]|jgi:DNA-binding transcriptional LysR family regulator|nr:LysR family transcriptional regulator [Syntrophomonadaceae bacterium]
MDLKYLLTLKTILETGNFQKAAKKLNYTQSTVTFQIHQLENELSVKLFERIGRKMIMTQAGKDILPQIDDIIQAWEKMSNYGKSGMELNGSLKIAMPETLLNYKMQPVLKSFKERAPGVKLSLQALNCDVILEQINNGALDMGVHYDLGRNNPKLKTRRLSAYNLVLIAAPDFPWQDEDFITENQKKPVNIIGNEIFKQIFSKYLKNKQITLENTIELWSIEAIKKSVASNLGVALVPGFSVEEDIRRGSLKEIKTGLGEATVTVLCTYHKNKWLNPAMKLFMQLLESEMK